MEYWLLALIVTLPVCCVLVITALILVICLRSNNETTTFNKKWIIKFGHILGLTTNTTDKTNENNNRVIYRESIFNESLKLPRLDLPAYDSPVDIGGQYRSDGKEKGGHCNGQYTGELKPMPFTAVNPNWKV